MNSSLCRQTDGRTTVKQYAPDLSIRGHKNVGKEENSSTQHFLHSTPSFIGLPKQISSFCQTVHSYQWLKDKLYGN